MNPKKIISAIFITVLFIGCTKNNDPNFRLEKSVYSAGDEIIIENYSTDAKNYHWTVTNVSREVIAQSSEKHPNLVLPVNTGDGEFQVNLVTYRKTESKGTTLSKPILIKTEREFLKVYSSGSLDENFTLYIDNYEVGSTTNGMCQKEVPVGVRLITIEIDENRYSESINVVAGYTNTIYFY